MVANLVSKVNAGVSVGDDVPRNVGQGSHIDVGGDDDFASSVSSTFDTVISDSGGAFVPQVFRRCSSSVPQSSSDETPAKCPSMVGVNSGVGVVRGVGRGVGRVDDVCAGDDVDVTDLPRVWELVKLGSVKLVGMYERALALGYGVITPQRLLDLSRCGEYLRFAQVEGVGKKLAAASFCRLRLCPMCQWRRSLKLFAQVAEMMKSVVTARPTARFLFLTVTVRNVKVGDLGTALDSLNAAFVKLMKSSRLKKVVRGWIKCLELTVNPYDYTTHPHIHAVLMVDSDYFAGRNYVKQGEWAELWASALGVSYVPCVDIQAVKEKGAGAIAEICGCFKYGTKGGDVERLADMGDCGVRLLAELTKILHKRRFVSFGGMFIDVRQKLKLVDAENLTDKDAVVAAEKANLVTGYTRYKWAAKSGVYVAM